jgi:hypothetical protein
MGANIQVAFSTTSVLLLAPIISQLQTKLWVLIEVRM